MPTILIQTQLKVGGTLTDADTLPTLADSTATFGIKRVDTGEVVVASGTAMTAVSTGAYSYSFDTAVAGVEYAWVIRFVLNGQVIYNPQSKVATSDALDGLWMTFDYVRTKYGPTNNSIKADLENDGNEAEINARLRLAIVEAEDEVITDFLSTRYATPLGTLTEGDKVTLRRLTGSIFAYWLDESRGDREKANQFTIARDDARKALDLLTRPLLPGQDNIAWLSLADKTGWLTEYGDAIGISKSLTTNTMTAEGLDPDACPIWP